MKNTEQRRYPHHARLNMHQYVPLEAKRIVDIGCNTGAFGEKLKAVRAIEVWGVEPDPVAAEEASLLLDKVIVAPFNQDVPLPDAWFDVVVFNDVLEHLVDPWEALRIAARKLRSNGCVLASIPNLRHIDNLVHILRDGDFRYEPLGIRDRTHLRFFTWKSIIRLFEESGYTVERIEGINECWWPASLYRRLAYRILKRHMDDTKYLQFVVVATPNESINSDMLVNDV